jgi:hypothetical protein
LLSAGTWNCNSRGAAKVAAPTITQNHLLSTFVPLTKPKQVLDHPSAAESSIRPKKISGGTRIQRVHIGMDDRFVGSIVFGVPAGTRLWPGAREENGGAVPPAAERYLLHF